MDRFYAKAYAKMNQPQQNFISKRAELPKRQTIPRMQSARNSGSHFTPRKHIPTSQPPREAIDYEECKS